MSDITLENLDLNLMLALYWLLSEQNVTEASHRLGLSQPATSRALGRLRDVFDDPLLIKSGRNMVPTRKAELLQPAVTLAIEHMRDVMRVSDIFAPSTQSGAISIACKDHWGAIITAAWNKTIVPEAPHLELDLVDLDLTAVQSMTTGRVDLTIIPDLKNIKVPPSLDADQFVQKHILEDRYLCCVRHGHPLSNNKITLEDYLEADHILVNPQGDKTGIIDGILCEKGMRRRIAYRTHSFFMALPIIRQTDAMITAPETLLQTNPEGLYVFEPPLPVPTFDLFVSWHPNWTNNQRHKWVRDRLFTEITQNPNTSIL